MNVGTKLHRGKDDGASVKLRKARKPSERRVTDVPIRAEVDDDEPKSPGPEQLIGGTR
jgi:hypothetical protein